MILKKLFKRNLKILLKYVASGFFLTILNFFFYIILTSFYFKLDPILTVVILTPVFAVMRFIIHSIYVFKFNKLEKKIFLKFLINLLVFFFSNIILLKILIDLFNLNHIFSQAIIIISLAFLSFLTSKKFVFK